MMKLKFYRIKKGFTVYRLSQVTGISRRHLAAIEENKTNPTVSKLVDICLALNVTPNEMLGWGELINDKGRVTGSNDS